MLLTALLFLAACGQPAVVARYPSADCENVDATIKHQPGVKPSFHLQQVEIIACLYGRQARTETDTCPFPTYPPYYFGKNIEETYGLKDATDAQLVASADHGEALAEDVHAWQVEGGHEEHDADLCLNLVHDVPEAFVALVAATRGLKRDGY
jgi:hypothetical protein